MNRFSRIALSVICLFGFEFSGFAQSSTITTYAGPGSDWPVSGMQTITQAIGRPASVVPDALGGFYIASPDQHRIYRVAADGRLTVIAGIGTAGFSGDGRPAFSAQLSYPSDLVLNAAGNPFIADSANHDIRKVSPDEVISTMARVGAPANGGRPVRGYFQLGP